MADFFCGIDKKPGVKMGTNYQCMRKGIGVGERVSLASDYVPDDVRSHIYCGAQQTPRGKTRGNPYECFQKGFGIGKKLQYSFETTDEGLSIIIALVVFGLLWLVDVKLIWAFIWGLIAGGIFYVSRNIVW